MELIFNDATSLQAQSVVERDGHLLIKTISATLDELRKKFSDVFVCKRIKVRERGQIIHEYNDYTVLYRLEEYAGSILGVVMYQVEKTPEAQVEVQEAAITVARIQAQALTDAQALTVKALYEQWEDLVGQKFTAEKEGYKFLYGEDLYKTVNAEQEFQAQWVPGEGTESIYIRIDERHAGTLEDPIPYSGNMELEQDKYYSQDGVTYLCNRDTGQAVHQPLKDLVGIYVEVAD